MLLNALYMVLGGMAIVFSVLGLVFLVMLFLPRFFKPGLEEEEEELA